MRVAHVFLVFRWSTERSYQCIKLKTPRRGHFFKFSAGLQSARTNAENSKSPRRGHFFKFFAGLQSARTNAENSKSPRRGHFLKFSACPQSARTNAENSNPPFFSRFFNYKHFLLTQRFKYIFSFEKKNYKCEKGGGGLKTPKMGSKMSLSPPQAKKIGVYFDRFPYLC